MGKATVHKRLRIGLLFTGSSDWVGGLYYIQNIVRALNQLPDEKKPYLLLIPDWKTPQEYITALEYPYADIFSLHEHTFFKRAYNKVYKTVTAKNIFYNRMLKEHDLQWLYPFHDFRPELDSINEKKISWIYDFQHKLLSDLFTKEELQRREKEFSLITGKSKCIVVSSHDSAGHLRYFYPGTRSTIKVLQFVSVIDTKAITGFSALKQKYNVKTPYFIVSNQFWQHKNHLVVLKAMKLLKDSGIVTNVIFTGKESDHRNPQYIKSLKDFVTENNLQNDITFLGFIPRNDQLGLMKESLAIIQPSKFEGWGTVVEDAKSLLKPVILSNINVHKEQMMERGYYFSPDSPQELADVMTRFNDPGFQPILPQDDHSARLSKFAEDFIKIFTP